MVTRKIFARRICNYLSSIQFYINNIARCLGVVLISSVKIQDHHSKNLIRCSTFLQVDYIKITQQDQPIIIPHNVSLHEHPIHTYSLHVQTFIFSLLSITSPYITQSDLNNTIKDIHTEIKAFNDNITSLLAKLLDTNYKRDEMLDKQDEKITELLSKFSTYEDHL